MIGDGVDVGDGVEITGVSIFTGASSIRVGSVNDTVFVSPVESIKDTFGDSIHSTSQV